MVAVITKTETGEHAFCKNLSQKCLLYLGPFIWNGLPDDVKLSNNVNTFKHKVKKTFLTLLRGKYQDIYVYYG